MSNYSDLLKDPRWQKKRLKVFERDNFTCVSCGSSEETLHVHHHYYINKNLPWDYPMDMLVTLCEQCHATEESLKDADSDVVKVLLCSGLIRWDLQVLISLIHQRRAGYKPALFRTVFHRVLSRFSTEQKKNKKKTIRLSDLLNHGK